MDIAYFKYEMFSRLEDFYSYWVEQSSADSTQFPEIMSEEEWFEQFTTWLNN